MSHDVRPEEHSRERVSNTASEQWRLFLSVGVLLVILSIVAVVGAEQALVGLGSVLIVLPFAAVIAVSLLFGVLLLIGGTVLTATGFGAREWKGSRLEVLLAAVYTVFGLAFLLNPLVEVTSFTALLLVFFFLAGLLELGTGLRTRPESGWLWLVLSGIAALVAGAVVLFVSPVGALRTIGFVFGVNLFASGVSLVATAMGRKKVARERDAVVAPPTDAPHRGGDCFHTLFVVLRPLLSGQESGE